jgi:hypothetical protein
MSLKRMVGAESTVAIEPTISKLLPPVNPNAPKLTKEGYFTIPPMKHLQRLRDEQLKVCTLPFLNTKLMIWSVSNSGEVICKCKWKEGSSQSYVTSHALLQLHLGHRNVQHSCAL